MPHDDDNHLFTRHARRPWWMGRPLNAQTWLGILILSLILTLILALAKEL